MIKFYVTYFCGTHYIGKKNLTCMLHQWGLLDGNADFAKLIKPGTSGCEAMVPDADADVDANADALLKYILKYTSSCGCTKVYIHIRIRIRIHIHIFPG